MNVDSRSRSRPQSITSGVSARAITRFSSTVIDGTRVKCW